MFNPNNDEKKLDWMYKGPNSTVDREEYLLGRPVDRTLEQLNDEDKQKQQGIIVPPKNRVEHECIPPSIRDFNKLVQAEQVDLSTKLQEDPLVTIKKREEETRRQFLQNPVQLKKLQKALKAQQAKKKKKSKKKSKEGNDSDSDLEAKLKEKLLGKGNKKASKEERDLDTILIHKFEALKDKLTEDDLQDILNGKLTDSSDESGEDDDKRKKKSRRKSSEDSDDDRRRRKNHNTVKKREDSRPYRRDNRRYDSSGDESERRRNRTSRHKNRHSSESGDSDTSRKVNYGLVNSEGKKIPFSRKPSSDRKETHSKTTKVPEPPPPVQKHRAKRLTEEEKDRLRREMMQNAVQRDKERERNVRKYREKEEKERKEQDFDPDFIHKQLLKSAASSSVESRIKANLNNIQRSGRDMDKHFSKR